MVGLYFQRLFISRTFFHRTFLVPKFRTLFPKKTCLKTFFVANVWSMYFLIKPKEKFGITLIFVNNPVFLLKMNKTKKINIFFDS